MADAAREDRVFTKAEFLEWNTRQTMRFELVDWHAVRMMTGAKRPHRLCVTNVLLALADAVRATGCEPTTHVAAVELEPGRICYPDLVVECGEADDTDDLEAVDPRLVMEVLSDRTRYTDQTRKLAGCRAIASVRHILIIDPKVIFVHAHTRDESGVWASEIHSDLEVQIPLTAFDTSLALTDIYRGLDPKPHLAVVDD